MLVVLFVRCYSCLSFIGYCCFVVYTCVVVCFVWCIALCLLFCGFVAVSVWFDI